MAQADGRNRQAVYPTAEGRRLLKDRAVTVGGACSWENNLDGCDVEGRNTIKTRHPNNHTTCNYISNKTSTDNNPGRSNEPGL